MNALKTRLTDLEREILRHVADVNGVGIAARANGILDAVDDDPDTAQALDALRIRGYVRSVSVERVVYADRAGLWITELGRIALEGKHEHQR